MAELTFKSPGVSTREIDLSGPTALGPQGTPAGIIGTALKGRAFVPITVATYQDFVAEFGSTDGEKFGPLAMNEWMRNARAGTYVKVLGVGDGKQRNPSDGIVTNAGFVVGERQVRQTGEKNVGLMGSDRGALKTMAGFNPFAVAPVNPNSDAGFAEGGDRPQPLGRMTWLAALMKDENSSGLLADSGIAAGTTKGAAAFTAADGDAVNGLSVGEKINFASTDGTERTYVIVDSLTSDVNTGAGTARADLATGVALAAGHAIATTKSQRVDALRVNALANDHSFNMTVPVLAGGLAGPAAVTVVFKTDGAGENEFGHGGTTPGANQIFIRLDAGGSADETNRNNLILAINGGGAGSDVKYHANVSAGIPGVTASNGSDAGEGEAKQRVTLTVDRGGPYDVNMANTSGTIALHTGANAVTGGTATTSPGANKVAVSIVLASDTQAAALNKIKTAILAAAGHTSAKITASADVAETHGVKTITFTQAVGGAAGDQAIANDLSPQITTPAKFSGGSGAASAKPVLRGAIMAADGVVISLKTNVAGGPGNTLDVASPPVSDNAGTLIIDAGASHGTVTTKNGKQSFEMYLNGHIATGLYPNKLKLSFDPSDPSYFAKVLNTDPGKMREAGHYLYAHWDVYPALAKPDDTEVAATVADVEEAALVLVGAAGRNTSSTLQPNYEDFQERFRTAKTPWFISQDFGAGVKNLFKVHALDDGSYANDLFKITIENISASSNENNKFGKFDVVVRGFYDNDSDPVVLEAYRGVNFDRSSQNYIARRIGDQHAYYDFDQRDGAQKLRIEGAFTNRSRYIRVELHSDIVRGALPETALPVGFRGHGHLSLDGDTSLTTITDAGILANSEIGLEEIRRVKMVPVPLRRNLAQGKGNKKRANADLCWGVQFERIDSVDEPNRNSVVDESIASFTKFFPDHKLDHASAFVGDNAGVADPASNAVLDSDRYNNNFFSLERVQVSKGSNDRPVPGHWDAAVYRRDGSKAGSLTLADGTTIAGGDSRFLDVAKDFAHLPSRKYLKFTTFLQQGFDGLNIFDKEKSALSDIAVRREFGEPGNQGGVKGSTIAAYRKAIDVMEEKADVEIQLLAIPGLRHPSITDYAIDSVENRFDAMLLMDIEEKDQTNGFVTGSSDQLTNVTYTVNNFESRNLDSSFAAAYFPDVVIADPATGANVKCPPSVAVLGAFSLNDSVSHPWFAPAGFTRGALSTVLESQVKLKRANLDALYEADINPITSFPHTPGVVVFGQKTLQAAQSALDRVNVRRLLIDIRRKVKKIAQSLLFEPNRVDTLARFSNLVNPVMQQIQAQQGLDRYKVQIDTSTTTQADVENNTIRGKIFLQPTRSLEFISLDFVVTNQGAEI